MQQSGRQLGDRHFSRLTEYIAASEREGRALPRGKDGILNLSEIARECEFDRQVLYKNPRCKALIEKVISVRDSVASESVPAAKPDPRDQKIRELERKNADLQERLIESEKQLRDAEQYRRFYEHAIDTGRNLIP